MKKQEVVVKTYTSEREYQNDVGKMVRSGYQIISTSQLQPRSGCLRLLLIGLIFPPKPKIVVTYKLTE